MSAITICNRVFLHTPHFLLLECFVRQVQVFTSFIAGLKRASELVASGAAGFVCDISGTGSGSGAEPWVPSRSPGFRQRGRGDGATPSPAAPELLGTSRVKPARPWQRAGKQGAVTAGCTVGADVPRFLPGVERTRRLWKQGDALLEHLPSPVFWELEVTAIPAHSQQTAAPAFTRAAQQHPAQIALISTSSKYIDFLYANNSCMFVDPQLYLRT